MSDEAKKRLLDALPHLRLAVEMARLQADEPDAKVGLAVLVKNPDGTGRITASFEADDFLGDVADVLGVKDKPGWMADEEEDEYFERLSQDKEEDNKP